MALLSPLRWTVSLGLLFAILLGAVLLSLTTGEISIPLGEILPALRDPEGMEYGILSYIRIPRTVLGLAVGGSLSLSGAILQGIYRNPLVEPYTLGISGGASMGITLSIVLGMHFVSLWFMPLMGFLGALLTIVLVYTLSLSRRGLDVNRMLLIGVMISFISSSMMMFLMSITEAENLHSIVFWTMGSLSEPNISLVWGMLGLSLLGLVLSYLFVTPLNALRLGEEQSRYLGVDITWAVRILFLITSMLTGACIASAGVIGFVGLVIPHVVRLFMGSDYRITLLGSFLLGGSFLILSDVLSRVLIAPNELPIGVITGLIGGTLFIILLHQMRRSKKTMA